ncbi:unnamed protein product [Larinioides sclopetarius]|uniref:Uncharacterized protein n=1 Tax=Larinioides sclopetarius TaxID=280406 RepID=A0AAV1YSY6_9ARAC
MSFQRRISYKEKLCSFRTLLNLKMEREENPEEVVSRTRREEKQFFELFYKVLISMQEGRTTDQEVENGIEKIIAGFREGPTGVCNANNFQSYGDELGYFYWSSPVSASVTREKTLDAFRNCEEFASPFRRPSLKVVSLGAGTGSDLVGFYSAIYEYFETSEEEHSVFKSIEMLLIDKYINWKPLFLKVDELLRDRISDFGNASQLMRSKNITTSFLRADLKNLSADQRQKISNAHIVWMKGIQSIQNNDEHRTLIIENIVSSMALEALLVILDSPFYEKFVPSNNRLEVIYKTQAASRFWLEPFSDHESRPRYCRKTNQELIILKKISEE